MTVSWWRSPTAPWNAQRPGVSLSVVVRVPTNSQLVTTISVKFGRCMMNPLSATVSVTAILYRPDLSERTGFPPRVKVTRPSVSAVPMRVPRKGKVVESRMVELLPDAPKAGAAQSKAARTPVSSICTRTAWRRQRPNATMGHYGVAARRSSHVPVFRPDLDSPPALFCVSPRCLLSAVTPLDSSDDG